MANLDFEIATIPETIKKEVTCIRTLSAGDKLKAEIGSEDELDKIVPAGKVWDVVLNIRVTESDV